MQKEFRNAFSMIELVFVIVVIGILSAIALPRFGDTADTAYLSKAQSVLASVRSSLATERQRRILRGDTTTNITDLGDATYAFYKFSADAKGIQKEVLRYPVKNCTSGQKACWTRNSATKEYSFTFPDGSTVAKFKLQKNKLKCNGTPTACQQIDR